MGVAGYAVAQGGAGDDGHIQKTGVAQQLAQFCFFCQGIVERRAVLAVACIDEDHRQVGFQPLVQNPDQVADILLLLPGVLRLCQHQHIEVCKGGGLLRCQMKVIQMLCHNLRQGFVIIVAGRLGLCAAEVLHIDRSAVPSNLAEIQLRHRLERQIVHAGEDHVPLPQPCVQVGNLVFLDAVLGGGIVNADQHMEAVMPQPVNGFQQFAAERQLVAPVFHIPHGGIVHRAVVSEVQQIFAAGIRIVGFPDAIQCQLIGGKGLPGSCAKGPQCIVFLQRSAVVAHSGGQPHHAVQQPDLVIGVGSQRRQQAFQKIRQSQSRAVLLCGGFRQPGGHQPAVQQLIHGENVAVTACGLLFQHPAAQQRGITALACPAFDLQTIFRVIVLHLAVQQRLVHPLLRHMERVAQTFRQILHAPYVVRAVVQRHVGNDGAAVRLFHFRQRRRCATAAGQQAQAQQRRQNCLFH